MKYHLVIIDPLCCFCDPDMPLYVPGAEQDISRLSALIHRLEHNIRGITVVMDSHPLFHISHPDFWVDKDGNHPKWFSTISLKDLLEKRQFPVSADFDSVRAALIRIEANYRTLTIWPPHAVIGGPDSTICGPVFSALHNWQGKTGLPIKYFFKGRNPFMEEFSMLRRLDGEPSENFTLLSSNIKEAADRGLKILWAGEALSHCVGDSMKDIVYFKMGNVVKNSILLTDCSSYVRGFEEQGCEILQYLISAGVRTESSTNL